MNYKMIEAVSETNEEWEFGWTSSEDTQCFVRCDCDNDELLSVSDYEITRCPNCGKGFITRFLVYRIPADKVEYIILDRK